MAQKWFRENLPFFWEKDIWPPSSLDCNLWDYFVCGVSDRYNKSSKQNTKQSLINSIMEVFSNFCRNDVKRDCSQFWLSLRKVVAAVADFICLIPRLFLNK
jgi:hypothetical protein